MADTMVPTSACPTAAAVTRLIQVFERVARALPDRVAVITGDRAVSYAELDSDASRMASLLRDHGVSAGSRIGILLDRSLDLYVAMLGILKAGCSYVPLDTSFPADRVDYITNDAELAMLVTTNRDVGAPSSCPVLLVDRERLEDSADEPVIVEADASSEAYVIYTSGSTGRPKGVIVSQSSIVNFVLRVIPTYGIQPEDRVYQGITLAFDFSIEELWGAWSVGATLVAGPADGRRVGAELGAFLERQQVTVLQCVPTVLATIDAELPRVRLLIVGGEAMPPDLVERWARPGRRVLNTYGPTETTVTATAGELVPGRPVTIGRPVPTYRVCILDDQRRPLPDGEIGEICIGGPGVAVGYLNRPDLTADRFISDPFHPSERLYRSGDLGGLTADGQIEYLGRKDGQVKIRGHRVEVEEIAATIREDDAVGAAVVRPVSGPGCVTELAAYLVVNPAHDQEAVLRRVLDRLQRRLPASMVPAFAELLPQLPTLAAGKVDVAGLPPPTHRFVANGRTAAACEGEAELEVARLWSEALGAPVMDAEADFFLDLGGHSLAAATIVSRLRRETRLRRLSIGDIYEHPTVRRFAARLTAVATAADEDAPTTVVATPPRRRLLLCGAAQSLVMLLLALVALLPLALLPVFRAPNQTAAVLLALGAWDVALAVALPIAVARAARNVAVGTHPLWGWAHLRIWAFQLVSRLSVLRGLAGSPFASAYLRCLGARVGGGCHLASAAVSLPWLVDLGDRVTLDYGVRLAAFEVSGGQLRLGRIQVGNDVQVGANSVVCADTSIGSGATIDAKSLVLTGHRIGHSEHWSGSPAERAEQPALLAHLASRPGAPAEWSRSLMGGFGIALLALATVAVLTMLPAMAMMVSWAIPRGAADTLVGALLAGPLFVVSVSTAVVVGKRAIMPAASPGIHPLRSFVGLRKWLSDSLMAMSLAMTNSLYATLYAPPLLRLLGARIGRRAEVSTVSSIDPSLIDIGDESFLADFSTVGPAVVHGGWLSMDRTTVERRAFVGNAALVPAGSRLAADSLVGVLSRAPARVPPSTSWLGSPAILLPRRQPSATFPDRMTFRPTRRRVAARLAIEYLRATLPASVTILVAALSLVLLRSVARSAGPLLTLLSAVGLAVAALTSMALVAALLKWLFVGRYRPRVEPLWSLFVRRTELVTGIYEMLAAPWLLGALRGTPMMPTALRLFGVNVGRGAWIDTTYLTEFDLVHIGAGAAVGAMASLQTHLFEDRVMKMSTLRVGDGASVGERAVVLYDATLQARARLRPLSLAMKGEELPIGPAWVGIPARGS